MKSATHEGVLGVLSQEIEVGLLTSKVCHYKPAHNRRRFWPLAARVSLLSCGSQSFQVQAPATEMDASRRRG